MGINEYIKIGSKIKRARKLYSNLTQREMANKLNLSFSTYSNYENNYREPSMDTILKIAKILGISVEKLINGWDFEEKTGLPLDIYNALFDMCSILGYGINVSSTNHIEIYTKDYCYMLTSDEFKKMFSELIEHFTSSLADKVSEISTKAKSDDYEEIMKLRQMIDSKK